jgi:5,10-methylene-tetrahydrofolate dehydrogenase/methenyl tetrahydrofolate cyclohydrolase
MLHYCDMQDMAAIVKQADIVVAAAGSPSLIQGSWIKQGAVIIDVGTNSVDDPSKKSGYRLVGDADFESCKQVCTVHFCIP